LNTNLTVFLPFEVKNFENLKKIIPHPPINII
jgi:hypothetical protein